jgi:AGZA family xanthine/uracil permease-like MFS transporter
VRSFLERRFELAARGTDVRTEVTAGLVTFVTLSYILFVQPAVLALPPAGMDPGGVLFATCVASAVACFLLAWWSNYPIALAPAMGHNFYFVFAVCAGLGFRWQEALAANFLAGAAFLVLALGRMRERVMHAVPEPLQHAIGAGIGLLIATVGLQWGGLVADHPATFVQLGELGSPVALLTLFGLALVSALHVLRVRGAIVIGVVASAVAGWGASRAFGLESPLVTWHGLAAAPPSPSGTAFQLDFAGLFARPFGDWLAVLVTFLILDLFDSIGTLTGVASHAGLLVDGKLPRARGALAADAAGTTIGAALGTSTVTSYVESAAGVSAGGRTGLTAVVVGLCFLAAMVLAPLFQTLGAGVNVGTLESPVLRYPLIAPALLLVGASMMRSAQRIPWSDPAAAIPCFLAIVVMPLSLSITDGIAWGFVGWSLLSLVARRSDPWLVHAFAVLFVLRYALL